MKKIILLSIWLMMMLAINCRHLDNNENKEKYLPLVLNTTCSDQQLVQLEQSMTTALSQAATDVDFTLLMETGDGRSYSYSRGTSTGTTSYESASTSKLVTSVVILSLVERGFLSLDSKPQDFITSFWTPAADNPAAGITLRHLLSFTSGFSNEPACLNNGAADFTDCVHNIYDANISNNIAPGSQFYYSSSHLQIAGLMAILARGFSTWSQVFDEFKTNTGLFNSSTYDLPSSTNPRLAGGMHWTGTEYLAFLRALYTGAILSDSSRTQLWLNQRGSAAAVNSPVLDGLGEDWGYALGNWVECENASYDCGTTPGRNSSPGAYGAYPFIDFEKGYFGILARQGNLGTFRNGISLFRTVQDTAGNWARRSCSGL